MTLQQLKYTVTVAQMQNISQAAQKLYLSQPSLTKSIGELEKEMNIQIFERTNKGVKTTPEGEIFLSHARQLLEQASYLEDKFKGGGSFEPDFSVSTQHYSFAVDALVDTVKAFDIPKYRFTIRETQTYEIIEDVKDMKSEIGVLYMSAENEGILQKILKKYGLCFEELVTVVPHIFIAKTHPLSLKKNIKLSDLEPYPYLSFEQGESNSINFSEELLSMVDRPKNIIVRDRATMVSLAIGLNGYTVGSGVLNEEVNGDKIIAKKLDEDAYMRIGYICHKDMPLNVYAQTYIEALKKHVKAG